MFGSMKTYYCVHERGTRFHEIKAQCLFEAQIVANLKFGKIYLPASRTNGLSQSGIHLFDDLYTCKKVFPKAKWSGMSGATKGVWQYVFPWDGASNE